MKALLIITGRGMGGDAITAINIAEALAKQGVSCEFALDHDAPGLVFKKNGYNWHKISIPQAGGHAATKKKMFKAGFKTLKASLESFNLIRKVKPDVVVGVIGGGAVVGCVGAKMAGVPAVGILITPMDAKVCLKLNNNIILPESNLFNSEFSKEGVIKSYSPINPDIIKGDKNKALLNLNQFYSNQYDPNKKTILFSSGSSLFEMTAKAAYNLSKERDDLNIMVVGYPLEEEYAEIINQDNIINLGYINWIHNLYDLTDLAILSDDGVMIHEAIACKVPIIALKGVKYGRYHNMAGVFKGAVIETDLDNLNQTISENLINLNEISSIAEKYGDEVLDASNKIAKFIISQIKK